MPSAPREAFWSGKAGRLPQTRGEALGPESRDRFEALGNRTGLMTPPRGRWAGGEGPVWYGWPAQGFMLRSMYLLDLFCMFLHQPPAGVNQVF